MMKNLNKVLFLILFVLPQNLEAQQKETHVADFSFDGLVQLVLENNKTLQAARDQVDVLVLEASAGNTPSDPEFEFGMMAGNPAGTGNKIDISFTQSFDFPSSYVHKSRLKEERSIQAKLAYDIRRQDILLQAKKLWINGIFLNIQEELLAGRLKNAEVLQDHFKQKLKAGEVSALSLSQANLQLISLETDFEEIQLLKVQNSLGIDELINGNSYTLSLNQFPASEVLSDTILMSYENSPEMKYFMREREITEREKNLAVSQNLPKLLAGYYSETVIDQQYRGLRVGFTVPLWENANKIKAAKSKVVFAGADADRFASIQEMEVKKNLERCSSLDLQIASLEKALSEVNDEELLNIALKSGEISLAEYIYSSELYFQNLLKLQELKRDRLVVEAELLKVYF